MYAPVTTGSEKDPLPIGDWKVDGVVLESGVQLQPRSVLGRRSHAREGEDSRGSEQSRRRRLGRHQQGALRPARHARAVDRRAHRIAWLHPADELGCDEAGAPGQSGN